MFIAVSPPHSSVSPLKAGMVLFTLRIPGYLKALPKKRTRDMVTFLTLAGVAVSETALSGIFILNLAPLKGFPFSSSVFVLNSSSDTASDNYHSKPHRGLYVKCHLL